MQTITTAKAANKKSFPYAFLTISTVPSTAPFTVRETTLFLPNNLTHIPSLPAWLRLRPKQQFRTKVSLNQHSTAAWCFAVVCERFPIAHSSHLGRTRGRRSNKFYSFSSMRALQLVATIVCQRFVIARANPTVVGRWIMGSMGSHALVGDGLPCLKGFGMGKWLLVGKIVFSKDLSGKKLFGRRISVQ